MPAAARIVQGLLIAIIAIGVAMRLWGAFHEPSLWLDEVFSAKLAESPLRDLLLTVPRFDTHPPLYYIQLHLWALFGSGDGWLILNSVLLDVLVIISLFVTLRRLFDPAIALWAAALWAVLPLAVFFAGNVRMYPMLFLLTVWLWHLLERRVRGEEGLRVATILLGLGVVLTHGLGFFVAFFVFLQAFLRSWWAARAGGPGRPWRIFLDFIPVALCAAYPLGIGLFRQTEGLAEFDAAVTGIHLTIALLGMEFPIPAVSGYLAVALIVLPLLADARARPIVLWLVLLPWAVLLLLSLGVKTVFMYRTLGLFLPFLAIGLALFFSGAWTRRAPAGMALSGAILALFTLAAANSLLSFQKTGYRGIAAIWQAEAPPDAMLFVDGVPNLWGFSRYLANVAPYSALEVQPPVRDGMLRVKQRLEGSWFDRAGMFGRSDRLIIGDRQILPYVPDDSAPPPELYWILTSHQTDCLRPEDSLLRSFISTGQHLLECRSTISATAR